MSAATPHGEAGDLIVIDGNRIGDPRRTGQILEVIGEPRHEHYLVRSEDGHESLFYPSGHASVVHHIERPADPSALVHEP